MRIVQALSVKTLQRLRRSIGVFQLVALVVWCLTWRTCQIAVAAVYTYTPSSSSTSIVFWSSGFNWNAIPVSGASTELKYVGNNGTIIGNISDDNIDDIGGPFSLNQMDLQGTGPANSSAMIGIGPWNTGNSLNFVNNGFITPVINLNANCGASGAFGYGVMLNVTLSNDTTFQGDGNASFNFAGVISGNGGLIKSGASTLYLTGTNTYSGITTISGGNLAFTNGALGTVDIVFDGGTLQWIGSNSQAIANRATSVTAGKSAILDTGGNNITFSSALSGDGGLTKLGTGTLTLNGANTYKGSTTITAGTLSFATGSLDSTNSIIFNGGTLQWASGNTQDVSGRIAPIASGIVATLDTNNNNIPFTSALSGAGTIVKVGSGMLTLANANTFSGNMNVSAGTLVLGDSNSLQNSTLNITGGTVGFGSLNAATLGGLIGSLPLTLANDNSEVVALSVGNNNTNTTYAGVLSGIGSLTKIGTGRLTLSGSNTFSGDTTISGGTLYLSNSYALQNSTLTLTSSSGHISFGNLTSVNVGGLQGNQILDLDNIYMNNAIAVSIGQNNKSTMYGGVIYSNTLSSLIKTGTGTLTITGTVNSIVFTINNGTMQIGDGNSNISTFTASITNNAALIFNTATNQTYSGVISGGGTMTKLGPSTLTLSKTNTYTGNTTISAGTLALGINNALPTATNVILDGGILSTNTFSQTKSLGGLTLNRNSTIDMGALGSSVLDFADSHLMSWSGTLAICDWNGSFNGGGIDRLFFGSSSSALASAQLSDIIFVNPNGLSGQYQAQILSTGEVVPVPEPSALVFLDVGAIGLLCYGRQRHKHKS